MKKYALVLTCLMGCSAFAATESKEFDSNGLTELVVVNTSGKVDISAADGAKASVIATQNKFSDKCKMTIDRSGKKLIIKVEKQNSFFSTAECDVDFQVKVPKTLDMDLTIGSGKVTANGTQGDLLFKIGSGDLSAEGSFKKIDGKSGSGKVAIKGLTGAADLKSGSGGIDLAYTASPLNGELDLKIGSGDVAVKFPKGTKIKTNFKAGSGELSNELGDSPDASFKVSMKAGSGSLKIKSE